MGFVLFLTKLLHYCLHGDLVKCTCLYNMTPTADDASSTSQRLCCLEKEGQRTRFQATLGPPSLGTQ